MVFLQNLKQKDIKIRPKFTFFEAESYLKREGKQICTPFGIMKYRGDFYCGSHFGNLEIRRGKNKTEDFFEGIFDEMIRFFRLMNSTGSDIVKNTVPYDIRTGKVKGRPVFFTARRNSAGILFFVKTIPYRVCFRKRTY